MIITSPITPLACSAGLAIVMAGMVVGDTILVGMVTEDTITDGMAAVAGIDGATSRISRITEHAG